MAKPVAQEEHHDDESGAGPGALDVSTLLHPVKAVLRTVGLDVPGSLLGIIPL